MSQLGRSMIEMLGVLAIVGVLVIGGLFGYRLAMNKYHAGKIIHDVQVYHMTLDEKNLPFDAEGYAPQTDFVAETQYEYIGYKNPVNSYWEIDAGIVSKGICEAILEKSEKDGAVYRLGQEYVMGVGQEDSDEFRLYRGDTSICQSENLMLFFVGDVTHLCEESCDVQEPCYFGTCCSEGKQCNGSCCTEGQECCNGSCHVSDCGQDSNNLNLKRDKLTCACQCPTELGYLAERDESGACVCNTENGFTDSNGSCACSSGKVNVNGKCMSFGCYTSKGRSAICTSQSTCHCYVGDERCGHRCKAEGGNTCLFGLCSNACFGGEKWEYNTGTGEYACTTADGRFQCAYWNGTSATDISCVEKNKGYEYFCGKACSLDGTGCRYGDCTDVCSANTYGTTPNNGVKGSFERIGAFWGCKYKGEGWTVSCVKQGYVKDVGYVYYCYKNGEVCAQYCKNPYPDGTCSTNTCAGVTCPEGTTAGSDGRCTRNADEVYCKLGWDNSGYWCYLSNGELCGKTCNADGTNCELGCCDGDTTDGLYQCCPGGYSYQKISNYYGCYKDRIGCYNENAAKTSYICELNGVRCASGCNSISADVGGGSCDLGSCNPEKCDIEGRNLTFQQIDKNYFGCYDNDLGLGCYKYKAKSTYSDTRYRCYKGTTECSNNCGPNYDGIVNGGTTTCGTCTTTAFTCPTGTQLLSSVTKETAKGCVNSNGITCLENEKCYANYGVTQSYRCGTGCGLDGKSCTVGICDPDACTQVNDSWVYNATKDLYECQAGGTVSCTNGVCRINGQQCGTGCDSSGYGCVYGVCQAHDCPTGVNSIRKATDDFYGCYNSATNMTCYPYASDIKCMQNGRMVGTNCNLDGTNCTCTAGTGKEVREPGLATTNVNTSAVCSWCPKGSCSSVDGQNCIGSSTAFTKTQVCMKCPKGKYASYSGYTSCSTAKAGNYTVGTGNIAQTQCPTGTTTTGQGYYCSSTGCATDSAECNQACSSAANVEDCKKGVPACGCRPTSDTCLKNADCSHLDTMDTKYFCRSANYTTGRSSGEGECKKVSDYTPSTITAANKTWTRSAEGMNWWSAQNWCKAQGKKPASRSDIGCGDNLASTYCTQSDTLKAIQDKWGKYTTHWLDDYGDSQCAYTVGFSESAIGSPIRMNAYYALCQ